MTMKPMTERERALTYALKELAEAINLRKLTIRKDFHLLNCHAYAMKILREGERTP